MKLNRKNPLLASAFALTLSAPFAFATPYNWTGATNGTWNTGANWSGTTVPLITDDLTILGPLNVAGALTINFDAAANSANSLNFTNTAATSILSTTGGKTLTIGAGGITTGAGAVQIGANSANAVNITLNAAQTWNVGAGGMTVTNFVGGTGTALTKTGAGNLLFNTGASNGFTGGLNVNGGTVTLDFVNLATPTNLIAATNALQINNGALTITGKSTGTTAQTFASTSLGAGVNTVNIARNGGTSATLNLGTLTANTGSSTIFSPTTAWTDVGVSTTERVFITAGGSVPTLPSGANTAFVNAGVFHRVAGGGVGTLRLAAVNSSGQLLLKANAANVGTATSGVLTDATASYQWNSSVNTALTNTSASAYSLLLNGNSDFLTLTLANSGTLTISSIIQIKSAHGLTIAPGTGTSNVIIGAEKNLVIAMDNVSFVAITAPIANNGSTGGTGGTASALTIVGTATSPGTVTLGGANTYTGATTITRGTLSLTNANALATTSGITLGGTSAATLSTSTTGITISAPITTANTGITSTIAFGRGTADVGSIALNGAIGGNGNVIFTTPNAVSGGNLQTINLGSTSNNYAGTTTLNIGNINNNLALRNASSAANALPTSTVLTFGSGAGPTSASRTTTFDLNGQNQTLAGLGSLTAVAVPNGRNHRVSSTAAATLTINSANDQTFGGTTVAGSLTTNAQITGAISLVKDGVGTFTLGGLLTGTGATASGNSFTGSTKVLGGILVLGQSDSIKDSAFDTGGSIAGNAANGLRTTPSFLRIGGLTGGNDFATRFTTTTGGYTTLTGLTLNPGSGSLTYSGDVGDGVGGMNLTKSGAGTQILTGTNTHTGTTSVSAGVLAVNGSLANTSATTVSGTGTLKGSGSINSSVTISSGGTLASGTSIESLATGALSFTTGSNFQYELDKDVAAGVAGDLTAVTGNLSLAGTVTLSFLETGAGSWELGTPLGDHFGSPSADKLTLISYSGTWNGGLFTYLGNTVLDDSSIVINGQQWWFNYNDTDAGTNFTGDLTGSTFVTMTVPEPRAALLGGLGMLALLRRRR